MATLPVVAAFALVLDVWRHPASLLIIVILGLALAAVLRWCWGFK